MVWIYLTKAFKIKNTYHKKKDYFFHQKLFFYKNTTFLAVINIAVNRNLKFGFKSIQTSFNFHPSAIKGGFKLLFILKNIFTSG